MENIKKALKVKVKDNVAVIILEGGVTLGEKTVDEVTAVEPIPQSQKVALKNFEEHDEIIRYGEVIGYAKKIIKQGSWIKEDMVRLPNPPKLEEIEIPKNRVKKDNIAHNKSYFMGYKNTDGSVGTKNMLGIVACSQCVEGILNIAVKEIEDRIKRKYPNIDGVMSINHNYGCGVAIDAEEAIIPIRTLQNLSKHPNFGGEIIVVALGCEKLQPPKLVEELKENQLIILQEEAGMEKMIEAICKKSELTLKKLNLRKREKCSLSNLTVGLQCGGSDSLSGVTANPALGFASDLLVKAGATVMFSEVTEVRDGIHLLISRATNEDIATKLKKEIKWYDEYLERGNVDRSANPTPGNKKGGLTNIVEKALGSIAKSGSSEIIDVVKPGERTKKKGLNFLATPASDFVCGTLQLAAGMTVEVFTTGRGTTYGLAMAPVIKVSSRTELKTKWGDLIDVDAGKIASGESSIEEIGLEIYNMIIKVASGEFKVGVDKMQIKNAICLFNPAPIT